MPGFHTRWQAVAMWEVEREAVVNVESGERVFYLILEHTSYMYVCYVCMLCMYAHLPPPYLNPYIYS